MIDLRRIADDLYVQAHIAWARNQCEQMHLLLREAERDLYTVMQIGRAVEEENNSQLSSSRT